MRPFDTLIRLSEQQLDEKRKALSQLESGLEVARAGRAALDVELAKEQQAAGQSIDGARTYGAYAMAMIARRKAADQLIRDTETAVEAAREEVRTAFAELKRYQITHDARLAKLAAEQARKDQAVADETAQQLHRRKDDRL
ncbi:flagellar FliJ family protein [Thalassobaculum sp.]|uniref:flagellar FliJ family protein n=1 Tax=Thalassobaculum sp. TaxID=2022740 RepID=UPI0032F038AA